MAPRALPPSPRSRCAATGNARQHTLPHSHDELGFQDVTYSVVTFKLKYIPLGLTFYSIVFFIPLEGVVSINVKVGS